VPASGSCWSMVAASKQQLIGPLRSPETYVGYERSENFVSRGAAIGSASHVCYPRSIGAQSMVARRRVDDGWVFASNLDSYRRFGGRAIRARLESEAGEAHGATLKHIVAQ
jgi:hypothetical protein